MLQRCCFGTGFLFLNRLIVDIRVISPPASEHLRHYSPQYRHVQGFESATIFWPCSENLQEKTEKNCAKENRLRTFPPPKVTVVFSQVQRMSLMLCTPGFIGEQSVKSHPFTGATYPFLWQRGFTYRTFVLHSSQLITLPSQHIPCLMQLRRIACA